MTTSKVKTVLEKEIGPSPDCRNVVWTALTDFQRWPEVLPHLRTVSVSEPDAPGRGSTVYLDWLEGKEEVQISLWQPGLCLEWNSENNISRLGIRFALDPLDDKHHIRLVMDMEFEQTGIRRIFYPLAMKQKAKQLRRRYDPLFDLAQSHANPQ